MTSRGHEFSWQGASISLRTAEVFFFWTCVNVYILSSYDFIEGAIRLYLWGIPGSIFVPLSPYMEYIYILIAVVLTIVSESFIKRIHVVMATSLLTFFGMIFILLNSIFGHNVFLEIGRFLTILNVPSYALVLAMILNQMSNFKQLISEETFLFIAVWIIFMTSVLFSVVFLPYEILDTTSAFAISVGLQALQIVAMSFAYERFASSLLYFNIHYLIAKYLMQKMLRIRNKETTLIVKLTVVRTKKAIVFLAPLFGFSFCERAIFITWRYQKKHTYSELSWLDFTFTELSNMFTVVTLPILFFTLIPIIRRYFMNDFAKIHICFAFFTLSILSLGLTQYFLGTSVDILPNRNHEQVRILNGLDTPTVLISKYFNYTIPPEKVATITWRVDERTVRFMDFHNEKNVMHERTSLAGVEEKSVTYLITRKGVIRHGVDPVPPHENSTKLKDPIVYVINYAFFDLILTQNESHVFKVSKKLVHHQIPIGKYAISIRQTETKKSKKLGENVFNRGSVYAIFLYISKKKPIYKIFTVVDGVHLNSLWLLPATFFHGAYNGLSLLYLLKFTYLQFPPFLAATFIMIVMGTNEVGSLAFELFLETYKMVMLQTYGVFQMSLPWVLTILVLNALNFFIFTLIATKYEFFNFVDFVNRELQQESEQNKEPEKENRNKTTVEKT